MGYCTKCGAPLSGGRYCTRCGAPVLPQACTPASQKGKRGLSIAGTVIMLKCAAVYHLLHILPAAYRFILPFCSHRAYNQHFR